MTLDILLKIAGVPLIISERDYKLLKREVKDYTIRDNLNKNYKVTGGKRE